VNKPFPNLTFSAFGYKAVKLSYSPPKTPTKDPCLDQQARQLTYLLGDVARKCTPPRQRPPSDHKQLLEQLHRFGLYDPVSEFAANQWQLLERLWTSSAPDCVFVGHDDIEFDYDVDSLPRASALLARSPLELLEPIAARHAAGVAVWLFWYCDAKAMNFPIAVACDSNSRMAGWVVAPGGHWWPIPELEVAVDFLLRGHCGDAPAEQRAFEQVLANAGAQVKPGLDNEAFAGALQLCSAAQRDLLLAFLIQSELLAELQLENEQFQKALIKLANGMRVSV
jgi:hypothetical protein